MRSPEIHKRIVLITGASRGIGAAVAVRLADPRHHVVVNYRDKTKRANAVAQTVAAIGGAASTAQADLTDETAVVAMLGDIEHRLGRLDVLVLNASGGLERGADPSYAMRLNRDAQERLALQAIPLMEGGGRIIFVTSHQAHFYPHRPVPGDYEAIAASKRAGEDALRGIQPLLDSRGIALSVVSGDMIDGTMIVRLLHRRDPKAVSSRRRAAGRLPSVDEFATAIADACRADRPTGHTSYVGGRDYLYGPITATP